ncbi:hypothetical protein BDA99DRAFT_508544 [Phascolomyces articulosus]|uniref:Uncharacterized protein n=1 Tax=Phascolomyces articulosus TaxID=60185 RepID=A0AAD5JWM6_9FUNG|nr:hypothetical protein BDA99DRAFT_529316 [Phascolomyces articulosus]KAI9264151.1 hypothetical protein BDA99DRAFT_508544 [Phascolomyces articulosus]
MLRVLYGEKVACKDGRNIFPIVVDVLYFDHLVKIIASAMIGTVYNFFLLKDKARSLKLENHLFQHISHGYQVIVANDYYEPSVDGSKGLSLSYSIHYMNTLESSYTMLDRPPCI